MDSTASQHQFWLVIARYLRALEPLPSTLSIYYVFRRVMKALKNCRQKMVERRLSAPPGNDWVQWVREYKDGQWMDRRLSEQEIRDRAIALLTPEPEDFCLDCGVDTIDIGHDYMLHDDLWLSIHPEDDGKLCLFCVEKRLGRPVTKEDFSNVPINEGIEELLR